MNDIEYLHLTLNSINIVAHAKLDFIDLCQCFTHFLKGGIKYAIYDH